MQVRLGSPSRSGYSASCLYLFPISFYHVFRWLGQNSKQNRLARQLGDIQVRMRLMVSGDRMEIRQSYVPAMYSHIVRPLVEDGTVRALVCCIILSINVHVSW